jgi:DNA-binding MarR family transcriptional regulator
MRPATLRKYNKLAYYKRMTLSLGLHRELVFQLFDTARLARTYVDQRARERGMTRAQWVVLIRLARQQGMMQTELADILDMQPISVTRLLDRLCDQGLVERCAHPTDRRANTLRLTARGSALLDELAPLGEEIADELLKTISDVAARQLLQRLGQIKDNARTATQQRLDAERADEGKVRHVPQHHVR